jgi:hypothetical protein
MFFPLAWRSAAKLACCSGGRRSPRRRCRSLSPLVGPAVTSPSISHENAVADTCCFLFCGVARTTARVASGDVERSSSRSCPQTGRLWEVTCVRLSCLPSVVLQGVSGLSRGPVDVHFCSLSVYNCPYESNLNRRPPEGPSCRNVTDLRECPAHGQGRRVQCL